MSEANAKPTTPRVKDDPEARFKKRIFELENKVSVLEKKFVELSASIEERALAVIEMIAGTLAQQIRTGREHAHEVAPLYEFVSIDEQNPANDKTFTLIHTENGPVIMALAEDGTMRTLPTGPIHAVALRFFQKVNAQPGVAIQANLIKTVVAKAEEPVAEKE